MLDISNVLGIIIPVLDTEDLCNGSTPDSDSVCGGSNPSSSAKKHPTTLWLGVFYHRMGIRKGGTSAYTGAKIESWRAIFSPWENPWTCERTRMGVGTSPFYLPNYFLLYFGYGNGPACCIETYLDSGYNMNIIFKFYVTIYISIRL